MSGPGPGKESGSSAAIDSCCGKVMMEPEPEVTLSTLQPLALLQPAFRGRSNSNDFDNLEHVDSIVVQSAQYRCPLARFVAIIGAAVINVDASDTCSSQAMGVGPSMKAVVRIIVVRILRIGRRGHRACLLVAYDEQLTSNIRSFTLQGSEYGRCRAL